LPSSTQVGAIDGVHLVVFSDKIGGFSGLGEAFLIEWNIEPATKALVSSG
jgi:hypothetical protein